MFDSMDNTGANWNLNLNGYDSSSRLSWPQDRTSLYESEEGYDFDSQVEEKSQDREKKKRKPKYRPIY
jgi:hypothetical protein